ncbi:hypothetical protein HETIRDRAFT_460446 [Heterobasidion irregulare TC 32-1]|uniref:Uncharacterized protein n=1 Tax=Heterobasidion irregulare (strain TC 32-1) TaxID=747525 RepID=W4JXQ2_HETIT|nr:uncharacterized protein HETIRDRAFT_460446 [Heterobasidion irregulare TC 32-1]ETW78347.1 hypothetical protein HETIRDRAFT_460446 [Heterobasidion irregulare TC 32-1]
MAGDEARQYEHLRDAGVAATPIYGANPYAPHRTTMHHDLDATFDWNFDAIASGSGTDNWRAANDVRQFTPSPDEPQSSQPLLDAESRRDPEELLRYGSQEPLPHGLYLPPSSSIPPPLTTSYQLDTPHFLPSAQPLSYHHVSPPAHTLRAPLPQNLLTPPPDYLPMAEFHTPTPYLQPAYETSSQPWPPLHIPSTSTESHWMPLASTGAQSFLHPFTAPTFANTPSSGPTIPPTWYSQGPYAHPSLAPPTPNVSAAGPSRVRRPHKRVQPYHRDEVNYAPPASFPDFLVAGPSSQFQEPPVAGPSRPRQPRHRRRSPPAPSLPPPSPYPSNPRLSYPSPPFPTPPPLCTPPSPMHALAFNQGQKRKRQRADDEDEDEVQRPWRRKQGPSRPEQSSTTCQPEDDLQLHAAPKRVKRRVAGPRKASTSSTPAPKRDQPKGKPEAVKNRDMLAPPEAIEASGTEPTGPRS